MCASLWIPFWTATWPDNCSLCRSSSSRLSLCHSSYRPRPRRFHALFFWLVPCHYLAIDTFYLCLCVFWLASSSCSCWACPVVLELSGSLAGQHGPNRASWQQGPVLVDAGARSGLIQLDVIVSAMNDGKDHPHSGNVSLLCRLFASSGPVEPRTRAVAGRRQDVCDDASPLYDLSACTSSVSRATAANALLPG